MRRFALVVAPAVLLLAAPVAESFARPKGGGDRCVMLARARGALVLVNRCRACRAVAVERRSVRGESDRDTYFVAPVSMVAVPPRGAGKVKILDERSCRRRAGAGQPALSVQPSSTVAASVSCTSGRRSGGRPST